MGMDSDADEPAVTDPKSGTSALAANLLAAHLQSMTRWPDRLRGSMLLVGDLFVRNSSFDGFDDQKALQLVAELLTTEWKDPLHQADASSQQQLALLKTLMASKLLKASTVDCKDPNILYERFETFRMDVRPNSMLIPWGWSTEKGGHAMLLEVVKKVSATGSSYFQVVVYNSGSGIRYHRRFTDKESGKLLADQALCIDVASAEQLNLNFWRAVTASVHENDGVGAKLLYSAVLGLLCGQDRSIELLPKPLDDYLETQISGTCTMGCIKAYLYEQIKRHFKDKEERKRIFEQLSIELTQKAMKVLLEEVDKLNLNFLSNAMFRDLKICLEKILSYYPSYLGDSHLKSLMPHPLEQTILRVNRSILTVHPMEHPLP